MREIRISVLIFMIVGSLFFASCRGCSTDHRRISPHEINLNGINLYLSKSQTQAVIHSLVCAPLDNYTDTCSWILPEHEKVGTLSSVDQIKFIFQQDKLIMLSIYYSQMLDFEYRGLEMNIRDHYGYPLKDTLATDWQYDSLRITLISNRREHWTGKFRISKPVLEFRENIIEH
jgi:hypothetical protein